MTKYTFVLDDESAKYLERSAERLGIAKSQVVREALRLYGEQLGRLNDEERERLLAAFDEAIARVPDRTRKDVDAELEEISRARRRGGRGG
jgi:hypothetical protein